MAVDSKRPEPGALVRVRPRGERDPEDFAADPAELAAGLVPAHPAPPRPALGLDLGAACGYALARVRPGHPFDPRTAPVVPGQLDLAAGPFDSGGLRFVRLRKFLAVIRPALIAFEVVMPTPPAARGRTNPAAIVARAATAPEWTGGLKAHLAARAEERGVACTGVPIGTIKRRPAGKGNASKAEVIRGVNDLFGVTLDAEKYESTCDDNVADAAACLLIALEQYALGLAADGD